EFRTSEDKPLPVIVQKAGGGYLYATTDLAAMRYRHRVLKADRLLHFVDQRQALHFQQAFAVPRKAGFVPDAMQRARMGCGTMSGACGTPSRPREGGTVRLIDPLGEAGQRASQLGQERNPELESAVLLQIARAVGVGAVKYAELSEHRSSDYKFSVD